MQKTPNPTTPMRQPDTPEKELIRLAHSVLTQTRSLMLPHHFGALAARLITFSEVRCLKVNVVATSPDGLPTHLILLARPGQQPKITKEQSLQDTLIIDLSQVTPTYEAMLHFLTETEDCRRWHHAPRAVISNLGRGGSRWR